MSSDQQTFGRGVTASLLGLGVQFLIAAVFGVLALWLRGAVLIIAAWQAVGGLALWLVLAIVYQQHKLERIEALEADELAQRHGEQSSIFQTSADDLSLARRRVQRLHRWGLPIVSLLTGAYLIVMGAWLFKQYLPLLSAPPLMKDTLGIDPLQVRLIGVDGMVRWHFICVISAALAFVAFLVCRYLAGMAKLREWSLLRGGAGYMMGTSLVAATLAVGYALLFAPTSVILKYLAVILPGFMVVIGLEIAINLVLDFYRPRKVDQPERTAFDSRLLSLLTSPESIARTINEAINYQFGFEVTRSWFWQLLSRAFGYLIILGAVVLIAISSMIIVEPNEQAVVTHFGRIVGQPLGQGLHWKLPWPLANVKRVNVTGVRQIVVGSLNAESDLKAGVPILWANEHYNIKPVYLMVAPSTSQADGSQDATTVPQETGGLPSETSGNTSGDTSGGGDTRPPSVAIVNAEVMIDYRISPDGVLDYLRQSTDPDRRLHEIGNLEVSRYLLRNDIDAWIGADRRTMSKDLRGLIQAEVDRAHLGLTIVDVAVASIHPPQPVADAFHEVITATQERQTDIEKAKRDAIKKLVEVAGSMKNAHSIIGQITKLENLRQSGSAPRKILASEMDIEKLLLTARGAAAQQIAQARADRWDLENGERAQALLYVPQLKAYHIAPKVYRMRSYLQAMTEGMAGARKFVILAHRKHLVTRFDLKELDTGFQNLNLNAKN